jgi:uncharacterized protein (TIGR03067 family)
MKRYLVAALVVGLFPAASPADKDEAAEELQGTWRAVSIEVRGESPTLHPENYSVVFKGDHWAFRDEGKVTSEGTFTVDVSATPKAIDLTITGGNKDASNSKGLTHLGIYEVSKGILKLCFAPPLKKERPEAFAAKKGSTNEFIIYKKENKKAKP